MMPVGRPRFEVIAAATAEERRLLTVATVRALTGLSSDDIVDESLVLQIDAVLTRCARVCRLATSRAVPPTLAQEQVRATWLQDTWNCFPQGFVFGSGPSTLLLPWRAPITAIEISEDDVDLVDNVDFRLLGAGVVERIGAYWPTSGTIIVDYTAGWVPLSDDPSYEYDGEPMPADLVALIAEQIRLGVTQLGNDLSLRSEDIPGVWSGSYNVAGGDAIDKSGLMLPLLEALAPYRAPPSFA